MTKLNKKCVICGNEYYYCNRSCRDSLDKPSWMASFCSENCKKIYEAAAAFNVKKISAKEARVILDTCDLSHKDKFTASTQRLIGEIYEATNIDEIESLEICSMEEQKVSEDIALCTNSIVGKSSESSSFVTDNLSKKNNYKKKKKKK